MSEKMDIKLSEEESSVPEAVLVANRPFFTSEIYKIEVQGLPKYFGINEAKKLFNRKLKLGVHKFKYVGKNASYMFLNFKNEEDREKAICVVDGMTFKGKTFKAFKSKPAKDPLVRLREQAAIGGEVDLRPVKEQLLSAVCPLYNEPYDEQIRKKSGFVSEIVEKFHKTLTSENPEIKSMVDQGRLKLAEAQEFIKSPVTEGYRNKCEFTIGRHPEETSKVQVGFRLKSYKKGSTAVLNAEDIPFVPEEMKKVTKLFEKFVEESGFETYNPIALSGHWKFLLLRINSDRELMAMVTFNPQSLDDEKIDGLKKTLVDHFNSYSQKDESLKVVSAFVHFSHRESKGSSTQHLLGSTFFYERLGPRRFKVSPQAFFQINIPATEVLYQKVGELAGLEPENTDLIDVCCGAGTIGLFLAEKCRKVYGVEIVSEAVKDAEANAKLNGITNTDFRAGKAEYILKKIFQTVKSNVPLGQEDNSRVVAIVDPPRSGLHPKAVQALRMSDVQTLVYISCDATAAMTNFINLGKPSSNLYWGNPFVPTKIVPVDLFPHTAKHFELIIVFERLQSQSK